MGKTLLGVLLFFAAAYLVIKAKGKRIAPEPRRYLPALCQYRGRSIFEIRKEVGRWEGGWIAFEDVEAALGELEREKLVIDIGPGGFECIDSPFSRKRFAERGFVLTSRGLAEKSRMEQEYPAGRLFAKASSPAWTHGASMKL